MNEQIATHPGIDPAQMAETTAALGAERPSTELSDSIGIVATAGETGQLNALPALDSAPSQAHPSIERMKIAEKAFFGSPDGLLKLIDDGELGVDDTDFDERTPVMMMAARGCKEAVKELIARGANLNRITMYHGKIPRSALDAARQTNHEDIAQLLRESGAKSGQALLAEQIATQKD